VNKNEEDGILLEMELEKLLCISIIIFVA